MLFSSINFLFLFFPLFLICYFFFQKRKIRNVILLLFSLAFYAYGEPIYVLLMIFSIVTNYFLALFIGNKKEKRPKTQIFIFTIALNLFVLFIFKYVPFFIEVINNALNLKISIPSISLPIGISFYTFQTISYIVSVYKGEVKAQTSIINLGCYITAFPQLIAGPIVRYETVNEEIEKRKENIKDFSSGIRRFIIGLSKKVLIADYLGYVASSIFKISDVGFLPAWIGMISYTLQIYYDFSGYSDMAIGLGRMLGFHFLENFNYPYISKTVTEFWRRWHMSLSSFFRDYVYIPLGGNRVSKIKFIRNILVVWALTGLWHGASWNFVIWGLFYGIILLIEKMILKKYLDKAPSFIGHIYTMLIVIIAWVIFNNESLSSIVNILKSMFIFDGNFSLEYLEYLGIIDIKYILALIVGLIFIFPIKSKFIELSKENAKFSLFLDLILIIIFILSVISILNSTYSPFIYFRF